ncbi:MAG: hypothetical protein J6T10_10515 [Methanobrevibacter sp.]|nr:hypothetical protein [Methanobrevibacter sp.]
MKIKVLKSKKTQFPSYFTPVMIVVKGEEEKGEQKKGLKVVFSKTADKKLPVDFKGGIIETKGENVNFPYVYEIKKSEDGEDDYPFVYIKDIDNITPLKTRENTCRFLVDEEEQSETEIVG